MSFSKGVYGIYTKKEQNNTTRETIKHDMTRSDCQLYKATY